MTMQELYEEILMEAKRTSITKNTRQAKISRAVGTLATSAARQKDDPLYRKMLFHKKKWKMYKERLMKKYSNRVKSQARK